MSNNDIQLLAEKFMTLFRGNNEAYGYYKITGEEQDRNKLTGTASTKSKPVDVKQWKEHITGIAGVGIIPITPENNCCWGCIDIDVYPINHKEILTKFKEFKIPIVVCRSKSNGAHCFLFTKNWVAAKDMRKLLTRLAINIGHAGREIYPAQDTLKRNSNGICIGNWLNMPYFNLNTRTCVVLDKQKDLTPDEFLDYVDKQKLDGKQFEELLKEWCSNNNAHQDISEDLKGAPPCIQTILKRGIIHGEKNTIAFNCGIYAKKRYNLDWSAKLDDLIDNHSTDKIKSRELEVVKASLQSTKDYKYQCKKEPLRSFCNSAVCVCKEFGIDASEHMPSLRNMRVVMTDPKVFYLDSDYGTIELTTDDTETLTSFRKKFCEQLVKRLPPIKNAEFGNMMTSLMDNVIHIEPPKDTDTKTIIFSALKEYLVNRISEKREVLKEPNGVYSASDGFVYFKLNDFRLYLVRKNIIQKEMTKLTFSKMLDSIAKIKTESEEKVIIMGQIKVQKEKIYVRGIYADYLDLIDDEATEEGEDVV